MSNTIPNIVAPVGVWSNIYELASAALGSTIPVTSALRVTLLTHHFVKLCTKATTPTDADGYVLLGPQGQFADTSAGEAGVFCCPTLMDARLNIQVLP